MAFLVLYPHSMHDFCPIKRFDHLEFYVGNAKQAAFFYANCLGFVNTAYRGLETSSRDVASYVMEQGDIRFVLTSPLGPDHDVARLVKQHGDGVGVIGLEVPDAAAAFRETTAPRARAAVEAGERGADGGPRGEGATHRCGR